MNLIFIDFEMNEIENEIIQKKCKNEIIQIGAIKLDRNLKEIDNFCIYIKPEFNKIVPRITELTNISNEKVLNACNFSKALDKFLEWAGDDFKILAWSSNDYKQIKNEAILKEYDNDKLNYAFQNWFDFQKEFCSLLGLKKNKRISLDLALEITGTSFKGKRHNALNDCRNTAYLYKISRDKESFKKDMYRIKDILFQNQKSFTIGDLLDNQLSEIKKSLKEE